jgi:hypothetical protein
MSVRIPPEFALAVAEDPLRTAPPFARTSATTVVGAFWSRRRRSSDPSTLCAMRPLGDLKPGILKRSDFFVDKRTAMGLTAD